MSQSQSMSVAERAAAERKRITVSKSSRSMRFYAWLYGADPAKANVCKLFWGFLLCPVVLWIQLAASFVILPFVKVVGGAFRALFALIPERRPAPAGAGLAIPVVPTLKQKKPRRRIISEATLERLSMMAASTSLHIGQVFRIVGWPLRYVVKALAAVGKVLPYVGLALAPFFAFGVVYLLLLVSGPVGTALAWFGNGTAWLAGVVAHALTSAPWADIAMGAGIVVLILVVGLATIAGLVHAHDTGRLGRAGKAAGKPFRIGVEGVKAFKYRTCPLIDVED